jgi:hypothetical protein
VLGSRRSWEKHYYRKSLREIKCPTRFVKKLEWWARNDGLAIAEVLNRRERGEHSRNLRERALYVTLTGRLYTYWKPFRVFVLVHYLREMPDLWW